jgi:hypothetical protein
MRHDLLREYLTNPRDFDGWLKANVFVGSIVAAVVLTMALAALYPARHPLDQPAQGVPFMLGQAASPAVAAVATVALAALREGLSLAAAVL